MKFVSCIGGWAAVLGFVVATVPASLSAQETERIRDFDVAIFVRADASLRVIESITYDFGANERHGIYRAIPLTGKPSISISNIAVMDRDGNSIPFRLEGDRGEELIRIGDPDVFVSGVETYRILYEVDAPGVRYFDVYDEVFWNVTGTGWDVPIDAASATVVLPAGAVPTQAACYAGPYGKSLPCTQIEEFKGIEYRIAFAENNLGAREGLSVAVGFPKGAVATVAYDDAVSAGPTARDFSPFLFPLGLAVLFFGIWYRFGRDARGRGTVVTQYDPPEKITPIEVAAFFDNRLSAKEVGAEIIHLAIHGYVHIAEEKKMLLGLFPVTDYILSLKKSIDDLPEHDRMLLRHLFEKEGTLSKQIRVSGVPKSSSFFKDLSRQIFDDLATKGLYRYHHHRFIGKIVAGVAALFATLFFAGMSFGVYGLAGGENSLAFFFSLLGAGLLSLILIFVLWIVLPARTKRGAEMKEYLEGLALYIGIAERDRIEFHNAPEKKPELFEKLLPYAIALGVSDIWAKEFESIYTEPPTWYEGSERSFSTASFSASVNTFSQAFSSAVSTPSSSGSGSGGGGFSGGGSGGGGGGSW